MGVLPLFYGERIAEYTINRMFFIDLAIMAQYRRQSDARVKWLAGVSPSLNWLPKKRLDPIQTYRTAGSSVFNTPSPYEGITNRDGLKRFECGLVAGAQVSLNKRWELGIYYNQGLIDLTRNAFFTQKRGVYNSYLQMELIYRLIVQNND
jgi:Outer membrane protein beta-barrel domain